MKLNRPVASSAVAALALVAVIVGTIRVTHPRALAAELFGGSDQHRITAVVARDKPSVVAIEVASLDLPRRSMAEALQINDFDRFSINS